MNSRATPFPSPGGKRRRSRRPPPRVSQADFERAALRHLQRFSCSAEGLRTVLKRRAERSQTHHGGDLADAESIIEATVSRMEALGYIDDRRYGRGLVRRLRARGGSLRRVAARLYEKGIASALRDELLEETRAPQAELEAALTYARRRRLGVHRTMVGGRGSPESEESVSTEIDREAEATQRQRDLAALARAGFGFDIASRALDGG
jgi:regulatory protein